MRIKIALAVACLGVSWVGVRAQDVTAVEDFGVAPASAVKDGLGFNIDPAHEWEFQVAREIGSTWARWDCGWATTEKQNPDNTSGGFALSKACATGLGYAKAYGQRPSIDALYGPPFRVAVTATVAADVPVGSYTLPLTVVKGSLGTLEASKSQIVLDTRKNVTNKHTYSGSLITGIDAGKGTVTLAAATSVALAAGTGVVIHYLLYPPVLLKSGADLLQDPSLMAFGRYAHFLAEEMHAMGIVGEVGLWNEPDWSGDEWDNGGKLFDVAPEGLVHEPAIPLYVASMTPVVGVMFDSGYTEKSGNGSIYTPEHLKLVGSVGNALKTVGVESLHPYGNSPEDHFWYPECMKGMVGDGHGGGRVMRECSAVGSNAGSNFKMAIYDAMLPGAGGGPRFNVTETGLCRSCNKGTTEAEVARFVTRQFIGFEGLGVSPIMFYRLADKPKDGFGWVDFETHAPLPVYTAMQGLMKDVGGIAGAAAPACALPKVTSYKGYFPLATVSFVGTRSGAKDNSVFFFTWQRSYTVPREKPWVYMDSPAAVAVEVGVPVGMKVVGVRDVATASSVTFDVSGGVLKYLVGDDPVEVALEPVGRVEGKACEFTRR